jgi:hypothetical protein
MTIKQLGNWIRCYLITNAELVECPAELIAELSRPLRKRWIAISAQYYRK